MSKTVEPRSSLLDRYLPTVAVLLPARDEATTIGESIRRFHATLPSASIWVIENGSCDATANEAGRYFSEYRVPGGLIIETKAGKGNAVRRGLANIQADIYVVCDADLTYPIESASSLLTPILLGQAGMVCGDRMSNGSYARQNRRFGHRFGNSLLTGLVNLLFQQQLQDVLTGFRAINRQVARTYTGNASGFDIEIDLTVHAVKTGLDVLEVPIDYSPRIINSSSKLNTFRDGLCCLNRALYLRISQDRVKPKL